MSINIAIDGPAGAGKSTIAKKLAKELGFIYIDTGAMYRAMGYYFAVNMGVDLDNAEEVASACPKVEVTIAYEAGEQQVYVNGENLSGVIRTERGGEMASKVSVYPVVRTKLVESQQKLAQNADVIMDGRDIGTVVLPNAQVKIFLTASSLTRAKRRYEELVAKGMECDLAEIEKDIIERDYRDMNRETSPLKQAEDAVLVDTSDLNIEQVVEVIQEIYKNKIAKIGEE